MSRTHLERSLKTTKLAEAKKRLPLAVAAMRAEIERNRRDSSGHLKRTPERRRSTLARDAEFWRLAIEQRGHDPAQGIPEDMEGAWDLEQEERLGPPIGSEWDRTPSGHYFEREAYDPAKVADYRKFVSLVTGDRVERSLDRYVKERDWSARQQEKVRRGARHLSRWLEGRPEGNSIAAVNRRLTSEFADHLRLHGSAKGGRLSAKSVNGMTSALSAYWQWMEKRGLLEGNPWAGQGRKTTAADAAAKKRAYKPEELTALLSGQTSRTLHDLMRIAALSGMRLGEIGRLTVEDTKGGLFDIREAKTAAGVRKVPIHPDLEVLVARRSEGKTGEQYLIEELRGSESGTRDRTAKASERFTDYRRSIGVDERVEGQRQSNVDFHSFRRWFVTAAERGGYAPWTVAAVVGHEREGITFGVYSSGPELKRLREVVESIRLPAGSPIESPEGPLLGDGGRRSRAAVEKAV